MLRIGVCDDDKEFRQRLMQMIRHLVGSQRDPHRAVSL